MCIIATIGVRIGCLQQHAPTTPQAIVNRAPEGAPTCTDVHAATSFRNCELRDIVFIRQKHNRKTHVKLYMHRFVFGTQTIFLRNWPVNKDRCECTAWGRATLSAWCATVVIE